MQFEWDFEKAASNLAKHGVSFELARRIWEDPLVEIRLDGVADGEERWLAIGLVKTTTLLAVVHIFPDEQDDALVRIVSARKATRHERRRYEQQAL
jgi:uncharacterized DUF497 family protein